MIRRIEVTGLVLLLVPAICLIGAIPLWAQGYGGMYGGGASSSGSSGGSSTETYPTPVPTPTRTPTPRPKGRLSLSISPDPAAVEPDGTLTFEVTMTAFGSVPGRYTIAALSLNEQGGRLSPPRTSMSGSGSWKVRLHAGSEPGTYPLLFLAQDQLGNHSAASTIVQVEIVVEPLLVTSTASIPPMADTPETRRRHKSWWELIKFRNLMNPRWFEFLCEDLYQSRAWQQAISQATKIDRDRLNITKTMAPIEEYKSYTDIEPIMSKYWADGGITVNILTMNQLGNLSKTWKAAPHLVVSTAPGIGSVLRVKTPTQGIQAGNVLNGVGATMILLDFWANMSKAETPTESREAWFTAGYASLDMYLATIVGNTFGSVVALPGMMVSYVLTNSYTTLIGGHKTCWFKKMVEQAEFADYLSENIHNPLAVNKVKAAMLSNQGLKDTLTQWWLKTGPTWDGKMGGCGSWNLVKARGYPEAFADRLMHTTEVEVNGKKYHPWSFYYSVSRMIVRDRRREMAREAAEDIRRIEAAYLATLEQTTYRGTFRAVSSSDPQMPFKDATVFPTEMQGFYEWNTGQDGWFTAEIKGLNFSPQGTVLLTIRSPGTTSLFVVPQDAFEKVSP